MHPMHIVTFVRIEGANKPFLSRNLTIKNGHYAVCHMIERDTPPWSAHGSSRLFKIGAKEGRDTGRLTFVPHLFLIDVTRIIETCIGVNNVEVQVTRKQGEGRKRTNFVSQKSFLFLESPSEWVDMFKRDWKKKWTATNTKHNENETSDEHESEEESEEESDDDVFIAERGK